MRAPPRWPLEVLHRIAGQRELSAEVALRDALALEARRGAELEEARSALAAHRARSAELARREPAPGPIVASLGGRARHAAHRAAVEGLLGGALRRREAALGEARGLTERRREGLCAARVRLRALEAAREAWRAARARDAARAEEDASDERVSARWGGGG